MRTISARAAKHAFGQLIDLARAAPVAVAKHGRLVVVVLAVEEFERLKNLAEYHSSLASPGKPVAGEPL